MPLGFPLNALNGQVYTLNGVTYEYNITRNTWSIKPPVSGADLALGVASATSLSITNSNGTGFTLPAATALNAGLLPSQDKTKLDQLPSVPVTQYTDEMAQDAAAAMLLAGSHTGVSVAYDDIGGNLSVSVPSAAITASTTPPLSPALGARWHNTVLNQRFEWDGSSWIGY